MNDIKRKVELWICDRLRAALPTEKFYPRKGGDNTEDSTEILPPFTVVEAEDAQRQMPEEPTYLVSVSITRYAHFADTTSPAHSAAVRALVDAVVTQLGAGDFPVQEVRIHGTYFEAHNEGAVEGEDNAHADALSVTVGVTG